MRIADIDSAPARLDAALLEALTEAARSIESFHRHRSADPDTYERNGIAVDLLELPVARAGVYVPGGLASYPSSVLMCAIPARVAGVRSRRRLRAARSRRRRSQTRCSRPQAWPGWTRSTASAGAQAIAAMAYGTETIGRVDVIVGPGSRRVSLAKLEVRGAVGMPAAFAGPSEVVVIADGTVPVDYVAIDLVVQAEHGPDGLAWLITWSETVLQAVTEAVARFVAQSPRRREIEATLAGGGYAVLVDGPEQAMAVANEIAPEHLELCCDNPRALLSARAQCGCGLRRPLHARLARRLHRRAEPHAADISLRPLLERARCGGLPPPGARRLRGPRGP